VKLEIIPGADVGFYSLGHAFNLTLNKQGFVRDKRFSPWLLHYEAEWLLRNELEAERRARLYAAKKTRSLQ
jgi:hypothetical protein